MNAKEKIKLTERNHIAPVHCIDNSRTARINLHKFAICSSPVATERFGHRYSHSETRIPNGCPNAWFPNCNMCKRAVHLCPVAILQSINSGFGIRGAGSPCSETAAINLGDWRVLGNEIPFVWKRFGAVICG